MDWNSVAVQLITAVTPVVTLVVVWALKNVWAKIPASFMFVVTPLAGILLNYVLSWIAGHSADFSVILGAVLGLLAVVIREFLSTLASKGLFGSVTATPKMF